MCRPRRRIGLWRRGCSTRAKRRPHRRSPCPHRSCRRACPTIRAAQADLSRRVDQRGTGAVVAAAPAVIDLAAALDGAGRKGEQRAIHRRPYKRAKPIPKRPSKVDPRRDEISCWPDANPTIIAVDVLTRLKALYPDRFTDSHLRKAQRLVEAWRADRATRVVRSGTSVV